MTVFACARCGSRLTPNLRRVPAPGYDLIDDPTLLYQYIPRMLPGTFAVDPEPFGPSDIRCAATRGTVILNPGDIRGTKAHTDYLRRSGCCRPSGTYGPNLVCVVCGSEVATEQTDCWTAPAVHLEPAAVMTRSGRTAGSAVDPRKGPGRRRIR